MPGRVTVQLGPQLPGHPPGFVEPLGIPQLDEAASLVRAEQVGEDALPVVRVVDEQQQITQADEGVRATRAGQRIRAAMHIADHVNPHGHTVARPARPALGRSAYTGMSSAPLARLQGPHSNWMLLTVFAPPLDQGITWS